MAQNEESTKEMMVTQVTSNTQLANLLTGLRLLKEETALARAAGKPIGDIRMGDGRENLSFYPIINEVDMNTLEYRLIRETVFLVIIRSPFLHSEKTVRRMGPLVPSGHEEICIYLVRGQNVEDVRARLHETRQYIPATDHIEEIFPIQFVEDKDGAEQPVAFIHR